MDLIITILPVVTKDLPISPRFTSYNFYRDASSALLQLVNQWLNFIYLRSHAFRYERNNTNPTLVRIKLATSALADVQLGKANRLLKGQTSQKATYILEERTPRNGWRLLATHSNPNPTQTHVRFREDAYHFLP